MTDVRAVYRPGREPPGHGHGAPSGASALARAARANLGECLDAALPRPLYATDADRHGQIEGALETMTLPERIILELEMQSRAANFYTSDYDPLRLR